MGGAGEAPSVSLIGTTSSIRLATSYFGAETSQSIQFLECLYSNMNFSTELLACIPLDLLGLEVSIPLTQTPGLEQEIEGGPNRACHQLQLLEQINSMKQEYRAILLGSAFQL